MKIFGVAFVMQYKLIIAYFDGLDPGCIHQLTLDPHETV